VARGWPRCWVGPLVLLLAIASAGPLCLPVHAQQTVPSSSTSWTDSITSPFKQGFDKLGRALNPKPSAPSHESEDDAISLKTKAKPGPELYVAVARLYEQAGKMGEAEVQYQLALQIQPNDLPALLGYARVKEHVGKPDEAIGLYQRAAKAHPQEAAVYNNLGLCYARQPNRLDDAITAMSRAVQLDPKNPLYRNNIATVLVDQGKPQDAFRQLCAVHEVATAYYNMGYLLHKKGQTQAATQHFALALRADPSMEAARRWLEYLQRSTAQARLSQHPMAMGVKVASQPTVPEEPPLVSNEPMPRRLPPTATGESALDRSGLPGTYQESSTAPSAPMPPTSANPALRMLPQTN
jgi:tetratricopeptide (TPR) repeat protein